MYFVVSKEDDGSDWWWKQEAEGLEKTMKNLGEDNWPLGQK
jgi:hypothetical protein